jgi:hypothetical protein
MTLILPRLVVQSTMLYEANARHFVLSRGLESLWVTLYIIKFQVAYA